ncbi:hypothetical protein [[Flexibacter] sp. ATCC 35208]|uniref:hypothetical protein n=1 Tax=[Flexibacter] sp. ATCC 35208 TaxID=1936242 RepID=UPI0009C43371|nr:hypothetical protein [[Flexibacter] sp. ATCC 35208]OMP75127.1 hypothetical protein BW716_31850 [[Flexibacter] sp. ATCC 35208]
MEKIILKHHQSKYSLGNFWLLFLLVAFFITIKFFWSWWFVEDWLGFSNGVDARNFFGILVGTTATFWGFLTAGFLLTYQLSTKEAKRRKASNVLYNSNVIGYSSLSAFLMVASIICYVWIPDFKADRDLTIGYFILFCFLAFLISVFPLFYRLLTDTNSLMIVQELICTLTLTDFFEAKEAYYMGQWKSATHLKLSIVLDEIIYSIRENDNSALHMLLMGMAKSANELIMPGIRREDCESVVEGMSILLKDMEALAMAAADSTAYCDSVSDCIMAIYEHAAAQRIPLLYFHNLQRYYRELAENIAKKGDIISLRKIIEVLSTSFRLHLRENCPPQNRLSNLAQLFKQPDVEHNLDAELQWEAIIDFIQDIGHILELAISNSSKNLYTAAARSLEFLAKIIEHGDFPNLEPLQRASILVEIVYLQLLLNGEDALKEGLFNDTLNTYHLDGSLIADTIINDPASSRLILRGIGDHLINARRHGKLNVWSTINDFGAIPRHTAKYYHDNENVRKATKYIFEVFKMMKEEIEKGNLPKEKKTYDEIKKQLSVLVSSLREQEAKGGTIHLITELESCITTFKIITSAPDFNIIPWSEDD